MPGASSHRLLSRRWLLVILVVGTPIATAVILAASATTILQASSRKSGHGKQTAELVALANKICAQGRRGRTEPPPSLADRSRLRTLARADRNFPRVHDLVTAIDKRAVLRAKLRAAAGRSFAAGQGFAAVPHAMNYMQALYRLNVRI
jgi:hypothetical protein